MRLFVAFDVPSMIRRDLEQRTLACRQELPTARWVRAESLHLTLVFIGRAEAAQADDLDRELAPVFAAREPMSLRLTKIGAFPPRGKARVVWIGLDTAGDLGALRDEVAAVVERIVEVEVDRRPFRPHLTLARCRSPWPPPAVDRLAAQVDVGGPLKPFSVAEGLLLSSELLATGARYSVVGRYPLGRRG